MCRWEQLRRKEEMVKIFNDFGHLVVVTEAVPSGPLLRLSPLRSFKSHVMCGSVRNSYYSYPPRNIIP